MNTKNCRQKCRSKSIESREIGFVLIVFGVISLCAFFLPPKAWILLLGLVLFVSGLHIFRSSK